MKKYTSSEWITIIVQTGLLLAIAQVVRMISSTYIYIAGTPAIRISFSGPFSKMPGILFGPFVGGIAGGIGDVVGFFLKPVGGYIPWFTFTAVLGGVLTPLIWRYLKKVQPKRLQTTCIVIFSAIGLIGIFNLIMISFFKNGSYAAYLIGIGKKNAFTTYGLIIIAGVGLLLLFVDHLIKKTASGKYIHDTFLKLLIAVGLSGLVVTTINTQILRIFIPVLSKKAFMILWIPRVIEELFISIYIAYMLSFLLYLYRKVLKPRFKV